MENNDRLDRMKKAIEEFTAAFYQRSDDAVKNFLQAWMILIMA